MNIPVERASVEKLKEVQLVQVHTPALEEPTLMQAGIKNGAFGGLIPALIAHGQEKSTHSSPTVTDIGPLLTEKLKSRLPQQVPWWPKMVSHDSPVPANYSYSKGPWMRVEVTRYELAPSPMKTLYIELTVSLLRPNRQGDPLWTKFTKFSGVIHGGEKIIVDKLPDDPSQLNREIERAAEWLAKTVVDDLRSK